MSATGGPGAGDPAHEPTEEELRAAYEAQVKQLRVEHILLDTVVSLINLGMRRTGLGQGTEDERDAGQVRLAIESVRALMPQLEVIAPGEVGQIRNALSQLQLAFVRIGGAPPGEGEGAQASGPPAPEPPAPPQPKPGEPGPAQRSGRLWIPGQ
jgi:hypothetical protein